MIIEAKFKNALKEMISTTPLEKINVTALCKKCNCHRQTFYYHYQDVYDLLSAILLNEEITQIDKAATINDVLQGFLNYCKENFNFLKCISNSAAESLIEDFVFSKTMRQTFSILDKKYPNQLNLVRSASRRFASLIAKEFMFVFKDKDLTFVKLERTIKPFLKESVEIVLPAMLELGKREK